MYGISVIPTPKKGKTQPAQQQTRDGRRGAGPEGRGERSRRPVKTRTASRAALAVASGTRKHVPSLGLGLIFYSILFGLGLSALGLATGARIYA